MALIYSRGSGAGSVPVLLDPEWIYLGIPLPEWMVALVVGFTLGAMYMQRRRADLVAA